MVRADDRPEIPCCEGLQKAKRTGRFLLSVG
jgi:hypothetical protein